MKLILENVKKSYDGKVNVLENVNYEFEEGKIYALLGRNGSGKTTLFDCINNDIEYSGNIYFLDGKEKRNLTVNDIGYCLSEANVPDFLTGREFIKFLTDINSNRIKNIKTPKEYFDMVNLSENDLDKLLKDYSLGMKNKVQMLVNIILDSKLLLLDEPLTSLDVVAQDEMKKTLKASKKNHILIFSTHIMELALDLCDEIVLLNNGVLSKVDDSDKTHDKIISLLKGE